MAETNINTGTRIVQAEIVAPAAQDSTNTYAAVAGSDIDARGWRSVAYTISIATQTVNWKVYGANASTYADEVEVQGEAAVIAGAASSYAVAQAPYGYYRVKIQSAAPGVVGTATVRGIAKA